MTARERRRVVEHLRSRNVSERRACRIVGFSRSAAWRPLKGCKDEALRNRLKTLAERHTHLWRYLTHLLYVPSDKMFDQFFFFREYGPGWYLEGMTPLA